MKAQQPPYSVEISSVRYALQTETVIETAKLPKSSVEAQSHNRGLSRGEPLILMMDGLIRYAKAIAKHGGCLANDPILGGAWLDAAKGVRKLCNGDGAVAIENAWGADSKSNGVIESLYWEAVRIAGFTPDQGE